MIDEIETKITFLGAGATHTSSIVVFDSGCMNVIFCYLDNTVDASRSWIGLGSLGRQQYQVSPWSSNIIFAV